MHPITRENITTPCLLRGDLEKVKPIYYVTNNVLNLWVVCKGGIVLHANLGERTPKFQAIPLKIPIV